MNLNFDSTSIAMDVSDFDAIPEGKYTVGITSTEEKTSAAGNRYLNLQLQVLDGPHKNRVVFDIINLYHPDDDVREIAERTLASICKATRVLKPKSSEELHNTPLQAVISKEFDSQYGDQNRVKKYMPLESMESVKPNPTPAPSSGEAVKDDIPF